MYIWCFMRNWNFSHRNFQAVNVIFSNIHHFDKKKVQKDIKWRRFLMKNVNCFVQSNISEMILDFAKNAYPTMNWLVLAVPFLKHLTDSKIRLIMWNRWLAVLINCCLSSDLWWSVCQRLVRWHQPMKWFLTVSVVCHLVPAQFLNHVYVSRVALYLPAP